MTLIKGNFYEGSTSSRQSAAFSVNDAGQFYVYSLENPTDTTLYSGDLSQIDISPRLGNTSRYLNFDNDTNFETNDNDGVDQILTKHCRNPILRLIHILESHLLIVLLFSVLVMGFMWGSMKYGVPAMANIIAERLPAETNQYFGNEAIKILDKIAFQPSELSSTRQQELTHLFQSYANDYQEYQITFKFRKGEEVGANALALPDGTIVFTDELVNLAENDHELVAILGHEIGHVVHRHILRRIIQSSTIAILMVFITGDVSSASSIVIAIPSLLLDLSYSREFEMEADDFAFDFLIRNNLEPEHFAHIMQRLENYNIEQLNDNNTDIEKNRKSESPDANEAEDGFLKHVRSYVSTHPDTENRILKFKTKSNKDN